MWNLVNGEDRARENPHSFEMPDVFERENLNNGDYAKLIFETEGGGGERMWVKVTGKTGDIYVGTLANSPLFLEDIEFGDPVAFKAQHIIDTNTEGE